MGVTFHTLTSLSIAVTFAAHSRRPLTFRDIQGQWKALVAMLFICVLSHGLLDVIPHGYPFPAPIDILLSIMGMAMILVIVNNEWRSLMLFCWSGCLLPDVIDLTLPILNGQLGTTFPTYRLFPWHWGRYSGSIFDGSKPFESALYHIIVVVCCLLVLFVQRQTIGQKMLYSTCSERHKHEERKKEGRKKSK
ncbi:MAG: hypothetical protein GY801_05630 [bacterium]|nr:hypothetical protein [bacterium]